MRRVVVTGLGLVAPTGNSVADAWPDIRAGISAVGGIELFDASAFPIRIAAEVRDFDPTTSTQGSKPVMDRKTARQSSRFVQFAAMAAREALTDSCLDVSQGAERYGCCIGSGMGGYDEIELQSNVLHSRGAGRVSPFLIPYSITNMAAGIVSIAEKLQGPNFCTTSACASGTHAIGEAFLHVAMGTADVMLAGGTEAGITPLSMAAFARAGALSARNDDPPNASRPFDLHRDGFVMGEGCGLVVLEEFEHALQREAPIYAEMIGYGLSADAHHITTPAKGGDGIARAMSSCLQMSGIAAEQVDYINAHGTSTKGNDVVESLAIQRVFGSRVDSVAVSSTKGVTGHCLGAAGGIEAVCTVLALENGVVPPTANLTIPDPECPLDYTPLAPRERSLHYAISNSCGFGGQNACIAFATCPESGSNA